MDTAKKDKEVTIATKGYPGDKKDNIETSIPFNIGTTAR